MTIYCIAQTRPARFGIDPEPAEYCENEVQFVGDLCGEHDADARMDEDYEAWQESRLDGTPDTRAGVTAGYVNPSHARLDAWAEKQELRR